MAGKGAEVSEAYRYFEGHQFYRRETTRGQRQRSKVMRSMRNIASYDLIDDVLREDERRRREARERQGVMV
jgi:hypothetical protein